MAAAKRGPRPRPGVLDIAPYVPGKSALAGGGPVIKLSSNETPFGPSPRAIEAYLKEAQTLRGTIPDSAMPAFLPVSLTKLYLSRIERGGTLEVTQFRRQIALWWAARNNRF